MTRRMGICAMHALVVAFGLACAPAAMAQTDPFGFMPDGGRGSFEIAFPTEQDRAWALGQDMMPEAWRDEIAARAPDLTQNAQDTLARYLAVITPRDIDPLSDLLSDLPPDGRDIALAQCLSCHSLFTGYLMQRRDRNGWLSTFASPFHQVIEITPEARAIFADYSAINMPMQLEDVPPELRY